VLPSTAFKTSFIQNIFYWNLLVYDTNDDGTTQKVKRKWKGLVKKAGGACSSFCQVFGRESESNKKTEGDCSAASPGPDATDATDSTVSTDSTDSTDTTAEMFPMLSDTAEVLPSSVDEASVTAL
jgi:hypothetical protein